MHILRHAYSSLVLELMYLIYKRNIFVRHTISRNVSFMYEWNETPAFTNPWLRVLSYVVGKKHLIEQGN